MVTVTQHCLDLEQWLCQTLPQHLAQHHLIFHGLVDYDLQLVDVGRRLCVCVCVRVCVILTVQCVYTCRCVR